MVVRSRQRAPIHNSQVRRKRSKFCKSDNQHTKNSCRTRPSESHGNAAMLAAGNGGVVEPLSTGSLAVGLPPTRVGLASSMYSQANVKPFCALSRECLRAQALPSDKAFCSTTVFFGEVLGPESLGAFVIRFAYAGKVSQLMPVLIP